MCVCVLVGGSKSDLSCLHGGWGGGGCVWIEKQIFVKCQVLGNKNCKSLFCIVEQTALKQETLCVSLHFLTERNVFCFVVLQEMRKFQYNLVYKNRIQVASKLYVMDVSAIIVAMEQNNVDATIKKTTENDKQRKNCFRTSYNILYSDL
jgi:hypothetical protein